MKKYVLLLFYALSTFAFTAPLQDHHLEPNALSELALALGLDPEQDLIAETQKHWLRKSGCERWEMTEIAPEERLLVLNWAMEQGFFNAWQPALFSYDKAVILGATTGRMELRLEYLKELWNQGIRFQEVVWLTGERPLDSRVDDLTERCATESEVAHILWEETDLPFEMRMLPVTFIAVPMKDSKRPTTADTIDACLEADPMPCKVLFVSNQPYCGYQFAVIKAHLPDDYLFDVVGPEDESMPSQPAAAAILLDTVARWLYQESKN